MFCFSLSPQVLLYDLRSSRPYLMKDHYYGLPIHSLAFQQEDNFVLSADSRILKIWHAKDVRHSTNDGSDLAAGWHSWWRCRCITFIWYSCSQIVMTYMACHPDFSHTLNTHSTHPRPLSSLQGSAFTAIQPESDINALCYLSGTGLLLLATEDTKMLAYYTPVSYRAESEVLC